MLSIKPIVYKHYRRADGLFPVKIRVTYRQQTRYFDTPLVATRKQLTKDLNNIADYRLFMAAAKVAEQMRDTLNANVLQINTIADVQRIVNVQAKPLPTVADFGRELADRWTADHRQHTAANYRTAIARLDEFAPLAVRVPSAVILELSTFHTIPSRLTLNSTCVCASVVYTVKLGTFVPPITNLPSSVHACL